MLSDNNNLLRDQSATQEAIYRIQQQQQQQQGLLDWYQCRGGHGLCICCVIYKV